MTDHPQQPTNDRPQQETGSDQQGGSGQPYGAKPQYGPDTNRWPGWQNAGQQSSTGAPAGYDPYAPPAGYDHPAPPPPGYAQEPGYAQQQGYPPQSGQWQQGYGQPPAVPEYGQPGYGYPGYPAMPPAQTAPAIDPMPAEPREYHQLTRGRRYAWWRPLLTLLLVVGFYLAVSFIFGFVLALLAAVVGKDATQWIASISSGQAMNASAFVFLEASLIVLIPIAMLSSWIVNRIRPRYLSSVTGGLRWRWLLRCLAITVPVWLVFLGLQLWLAWDYGPKPEQWGALLILVIVGIPFQSAAEEYAFRGLILQNVGAWFKNRKVGLVVATIPSIGLFALAHGSFHPLMLADLALFALSSIVLLWRTGGMEASIAVHATNNVILMILTILFGGWADAFVTSGSTGSLWSVLLDIVVYGVPVALILWQAKRTNLQRRFQPTTPAQQSPAPAPWRAFPYPPAGQAR